MIDSQRVAAFADAPIPAQQHLIDGRAQAARDNAELDVLSPRNGRVLTTLADGSAADVDDAVAAARRSFESGAWSNQAPAQRKKVLMRLADLIEEHAYELAVLGVRDNGTEISMALKAEPGSAAGTFRYYGETIDKISGQVAPTAATNIGLVLRQAIGVVGCIVP